MPMNSYSARKGRISDDKTTTSVESTVTVHAPEEHTEVTEITIRVRPASQPHAANFNEFDVSQTLVQELNRNSLTIHAYWLVQL